MGPARLRFGFQSRPEAPLRVTRAHNSPGLPARPRHQTAQYLKTQNHRDFELFAQRDFRRSVSSQRVSWVFPPFAQISGRGSVIG